MTVLALKRLEEENRRMCQAFFKPNVKTIWQLQAQYQTAVIDSDLVRDLSLKITDYVTNENFSCKTKMFHKIYIYIYTHIYIYIYI